MMNDVIIWARNLSKIYHIGAKQARYKTFRDTLIDALANPFRRMSRLLRGETASASGLQESVWALKDISFDIRQGEVVGVIGKNGAGKSTLLKILSRITEPSGGRAKVYGRIGSLLEVGTGFHPELTGRENIFLNGAILGMRRDEIDQKFDEIVAFAEIDKFIDTPVKFYSSGMYVRLAFAVAAHLEPEILLVDEVLAVGDAAFQKKCLGKMGDVAESGRTILFVSHNMAAIQSLCHRVIMLDRGTIKSEGPVGKVVQEYLSEQTQLSYTRNLTDRLDRQGNGQLKIQELRIESPRGNDICLAGDPILVKMFYSWQCPPLTIPVNIGFTLWTMNRQAVAECKTAYFNSPLILNYPEGVVTCKIPSLPLFPGEYIIDYCVKFAGEMYDCLQNAKILSVEPSDYLGGTQLDSSVGAVVLLKQDWQSLPLQ